MGINKDEALVFFSSKADLLMRHIDLVQHNPGAQTVYLPGASISTDVPYFRMFQFVDQGAKVTYYITDIRGVVFVYVISPFWTQFLFTTGGF